ncbi:MAG: ABC transporter permease [Lachnospiraceae bacterium]|nr:ABC transporter permease [Lachnospiraceae bacterium]
MKNKKIIFKVTKSYMMKNKKRTFITFAGILVMVILMTAVFIGKDTIMEFMQKAVEADQGKWHYQVYDLDRSRAEAIAALGSVEKMGVSRALGYTEFPQSGNPEYTPYLEIKGYSEEIFDWMNIRVKEGRFPENENEILLSERALKEGSDIQIGDTIDIDTFERYIHAFYKEGEEEEIAEGAEPGGITFFSGFHVQHGDTVKLPDHFGYCLSNADFEIIHIPTGLKKTVTVVGIMEAPYYEAQGQGGYIALMLTDGEIGENEHVNVVLTTDLNSREDIFGKIAQILDDARTEEERQAVREQGSGYYTDDGTLIPTEEGRIVANSMLLLFAAKGTDGNLNALMIFAQAFFIILITAAALILIYNVFSISFNERSRYLGMLSSVGATRKQRKWSVYYEVFSLLIPAIPLGILLGLLLVKGAMSLLYPHFADIISMIATNVITGRSCEIECRLVVNPLNILFIIFFSALAVWVSAWLPALKISKIGPVESIRGGERAAKGKTKRFKPLPGLMKKGMPEQLLAAASVSRNPYSTKGIIRSITAFIVLTLVTSFAVRSFADILKSKANREEFIPGEKYQGYTYSFGVDDELQYANGVSDILSSDELESYTELNMAYFKYNIAIGDYTEEFYNTLKTLLEMYFPNGIPETIASNFLKPESVWANPEVNMLTIADEDFEKLADKAGADLSGLTNPVLAYDTVVLTTDEFRFSYEGSVKPDYTNYQLKKVLNVKEGESFNLLTTDYIEETEEVPEIDIPVSFAGYLNAKDLEEYGSFNGKALWIIVPAKTAAYLDSNTPKGNSANIGTRSILFNVNTDDSALIRRLSQIKNEFGDSALSSSAMLSEYTDFKNAALKIVSIVAVCFTLLIAVICLLNLYNSVMGRRLARQRELTALASVGITNKQRMHMLLWENVRLLARSFIYSALITTAFVVCLRMMLNSRFGRMIFTLPFQVIAVTVLVSCAGLFIFTALCYSEKRKSELIDEVRTEMV